jgi:hypothetical protein
MKNSELRQLLVAGSSLLAFGGGTYLGGATFALGLLAVLDGIMIGVCLVGAVLVKDNKDRGECSRLAKMLLVAALFTIVALRKELQLPGDGLIYGFLAVILNSIAISSFAGFCLSLRGAKQNSETPS